MEILDRYRRAPLLSAKEERECYENKDYEKLVMHNLRLPYYVAIRVAPRSRYFDDLVCEGILGLMKAARKFDPNRGRFTTIAIRHIRKAIIEALPKYSYNLVRLSIGGAQKKWRKERDERLKGNDNEN